MTVAEALFPVLGCAILLAPIVAFLLVARTPSRLHDLQVSLYLSHRRSLVLGAVFLVAIAGLTILLGVTFIDAGYFYGWGFFPLAGVPLVMLGFYGYVSRLPFHYPDDDEVDDSAPIGGLD